MTSSSYPFVYAFGLTEQGGFISSNLSKSKVRPGSPFQSKLSRSGQASAAAMIPFNPEKAVIASSTFAFCPNCLSLGLGRLFHGYGREESS